MNCFNHSGVQGVAICRSCGRALCHECIVEVGKSTACHERCEAAVAKQNEIIERNSTVYPKTANTFLRTGVFTILLGVCFSWLGIEPIRRGSTDSANFVFAALGLLFVLWGIVQFWAARNWRRK